MFERKCRQRPSERAPATMADTKLLRDPIHGTTAGKGWGQMSAKPVTSAK